MQTCQLIIQSIASGPCLANFLPKKDLICTPKLELLEPAVRQLSVLLVFLLAEAVGSSWPIVLCRRQSHQPSLFMTESD